MQSESSTREGSALLFVVHCFLILFISASVFALFLRKRDHYVRHQYWQFNYKFPGAAAVVVVGSQLSNFYRSIQ